MTGMIFKLWNNKSENRVAPNHGYESCVVFPVEKSSIFNILSAGY